MSVPGCAGDCGQYHADGHCDDGTPWVAQGHTISSLTCLSLLASLVNLKYKHQEFFYTWALIYDMIVFIDCGYFPCNL